MQSFKYSPFRRLGSALLLSQTESDNTSATSWCARAAVGRTANSGINQPASTTYNTCFSLGGSLWVNSILCCIIAVPIAAPLPDVSTHIIQTKFIGSQQFHLMRAFLGIILLPSHIGKSVASAIEIPFGTITTLSGIFPLGLGGQTE